MAKKHSFAAAMYARGGDFAGSYRNLSRALATARRTGQSKAKRRQIVKAYLRSNDAAREVYESIPGTE